MSIRYMNQKIATSSRVTLNGEDKNNAVFYAPLSGGTSGQTLVSQGNGNAPEWQTVVNEIIVNGAKTSDPDFYAPLSGGTSGQTLVSNGTGKAPTWENASVITLNDTIVKDPDFYAPLGGGTSGQVLTSKGDGVAPEWENAAVVTLNDTIVKDPDFYAPLGGGTSGQVLTSKGDGNAPEWENAAVVTLNNKVVKDPDFYAPLSGGTSGYTLVSQGDGNAPEWEKTLNKINLNSKDVTDATLYAPVSGGTSGQVLTSKGDGVAPEWENAAVITINSKVVKDPDFYAPLSGGTSGQTLKSAGDGAAPFWQNDIEMISLTKAEYDALSTEEKNDQWKIYTITDDGDGTGSTSGSSIDVYINGKKTTHPYFYAPVSAGTSGYTLQADADGIPVWVSGSSASVNLNGEDTTEAKFYAPLSGGTSGQTLISNGDGKAPEWKATLQAVSLTKAEYSALTETEKNDPLKLYTITDDDAVSYPLQDIYDMLHPVGEIVLGFTAPNVPTAITATWEDISADYDNRALWVSSPNATGTKFDPSLPNITGETREVVGNLGTRTGALSGSHYWTDYNLTFGSDNVGTSTVIFNAHNSNSIYGGDAGDNVVRPNAVTIKIWKRTA